jgi:hypothetical protein
MIWSYRLTVSMRLLVPRQRLRGSGMVGWVLQQSGYSAHFEFRSGGGFVAPLPEMFSAGKVSVWVSFHLSKDRAY